MKETDRKWIEQRLLERFLRYVRIDTTSDRKSKNSPTTEGQLELARMLAEVGWATGGMTTVGVWIISKVRKPDPYNRPVKMVGL